MTDKSDEASTTAGLLTTAAQALEQFHDVHVDDDGALRGLVSERALARRYIRETRQTSTLEESPTGIAAIVDVLQGEFVCGEDREASTYVFLPNCFA